MGQILKACALEFKEGMSAPIVKAYAEGRQTELLLEIARKHNIPIEQSETEELFDILKTVPLDTSIPPQLYESVARIFAFLYAKTSEY